MNLLEKFLKKTVDTVTHSVKTKAESAIAGAIDGLSDKAAENISNKIKEKLKDDEPAAAPENGAAAGEGVQGGETAAMEAAPEDYSDKIRLDSSVNRKKIQVAPLGNYMNQLAEDWNNQAEVGYVYTINLSDTASMGALGLVKAKYKLNISCSHVGPTPYGVYRGSLGFACNADYSGLQALAMSLAGGMTARPDCWFRNDNFLMKLVPYSAEDEEGFQQTLGKTYKTEEEEQLANSMESAVMASNGPVKPLPAGDPSGYWCDWEYRMTEGDMANHASMTIYAGMAHAEADLSNDGHSLTSHGAAHFPIIGTFRSHYDEIIDSPFPYHLKFYDNGTVVVDLYGTGSSTVFLRFKGTWDKIPVENTTVVS